jgi:serine/threonine-protein kinase
MVGSAFAGNADSLIGQELCGYTIRRKLAEGGMGVVYAAEHGKIGRTAAIKVLKIELCHSEEMLERFYQEARAVNSIRHENIVDVYDFGRDPHGRVFFVMEYLEGEPLSGRIRRGALTWAEAFPILDQTLRALKAAHDKGFVHRDLKPDNIWLRQVDGRTEVKLLDFGIAKLVGTERAREKLTQPGSVVGTPHYMSPEQINGARAIDHRTDVYAMGVITYEMFAGRTPFGGDTLQAIMFGHLFNEPPHLDHIPPNLGVPAPVAEIVDRMLVKDPAGRYARAADVLADLYDVNRNRKPTHAELLRRTQPTPAPIATPAAPPRGSRKRAIAFGGVFVAAVIGIASLAIWRSQPEPLAAQAVAPMPPPVAPDSGRKSPAAPRADVLDHAAARASAQALLRASLRETEPLVRTQGSDALGKLKDQQSAPTLTDLTEHDPDGEVRGHAGEALGMAGASSAAQLLGKLETAASPPLQVWYASALARLGDRGAVKRLAEYARSKDLAVAFKAAITLAELSPPGDRNALAALKALAAHEAELNGLSPYAGALILTKLAALHDSTARKALYAILDNQDEGARLAAAEGLAKLGDDAGKAVLHDVFANPTSPNRLVAAVAQIPLGEYGGLALITQQLSAKDPGTRRLAARALGDIGEPGSVAALVTLTGDKDWTVRIAAAAAVIAIVGFDPQILEPVSVGWTKGALESQDWAVRHAAASVLANLPEKQALLLLALAIADPNPQVRIAASRSAGKMKTAEAVAKILVAIKAETDPGVREQQVKALGELGNAAAHDVLAEISKQDGRIGVLAAGSLIAVGDVSGKAKLDAAISAPATELRLAAVQAAAAAKSPSVLPTLKMGTLDRVFEIRFAAAEGLSLFNAEKAAAVPVLRAALDSKDAGIVGRALAALTRLGETIPGRLRTPGDMLDSPDSRQRLAAVPFVRALQTAEEVPLLRRLVADMDQDVRRAGVDAIEDIVIKDKDQAIKLYKPLVNNGDPVVRSMASGQLTRLVPVQLAAASPPRVDDVVPNDKAVEAEDKVSGRFVEALDQAGPGSGSATTTAVMPGGKGYCDTLNVDAIMSQSANQYNNGFASMALSIIVKALNCNQSVRVYRMAGMYACAAHDTARAKNFFKKVPSDLQSGIEQKCQLEHIDLRAP